MGDCKTKYTGLFLAKTVRCPKYPDDLHPPHLPDDVIEFRFDLAWDTILGSMPRSRDLSTRDLKDHASALIDYIFRALKAPKTKQRRRETRA